MIREPTVLILGAGASHPYGFPLGGELVDGMLADLFSPSSDTHLQKVLADSGLHRPGDIEDFREDLLGSGLRSIDLFLEDLEPDHVYVQIGKMVIAHTVLYRENPSVFFQNKPHRHWYEYVWNLMRPGTSRDNLNENGLNIVTFNYERSFEYYFTKAIKHSFRIPRWDDAWSLFRDTVQVVHVHGEVGPVESFGTHPRPFSPDVVGKAAAGIRVVHDPTATDDPRFKEARELIAHANRVGFVGFGYHPTNLARLDLPSCLRGEIVGQGGPYASAFEMAVTEIAVAAGAIGVPARFASSDLDALGFFKELLALT